MAKVKISGIASYDDALDATNLGADYIAFSFVKDSPKKVSDKMAKDIILRLPPFVLPVVIFANEEQKTISKIVKKCSLKNIQFDGDEAPEFCNAAREALGVKVFKSFKCRAACRVDMIVDQNGKVWILENNTVPGMTETSLLPDGAKAAGINFEELVLKIIECSL